jgi:hypothetical protein
MYTLYTDNFRFSTKYKIRYFVAKSNAVKQIAAESCLHTVNSAPLKHYKMQYRR